MIAKHHDGSYYFNDHRRTKHHPMIKQAKIDATNRIVG